MKILKESLRLICCSLICLVFFVSLFCALAQMYPIVGVFIVSVFGDVALRLTFFLSENSGKYNIKKGKNDT
ncbi:hypothetical protein GHK52_10950 [Lactococcus garvieae]|nr:hypothetical protein [Lactococcus garvieae]